MIQKLNGVWLWPKESRRLSKNRTPWFMRGLTRKIGQRFNDFLARPRGQPSVTLTRLRELARTNPRSFVARYLHGAALQDVGDFVGAASEFEEALALRNDGYDVWSPPRLEGIYTSWDDSRLESFYRRSMERDRESYVAAHNLGMLYSRLGRDEDALECFRCAHELKPERFMAVFNGANSLLRLGQYQQAIDSYGHAAERDPDNPEPWHSSGVAHATHGRPSWGLQSVSPGGATGPRLPRPHGRTSRACAVSWTFAAVR